MDKCLFCGVQFKKSLYRRKLRSTEQLALPAVLWRVVVPEGERTPLTPPPRASSSLDLRESSWSAVTRAEAAN